MILSELENHYLVCLRKESSILSELQTAIKFFGIAVLYYCRTPEMIMRKEKNHILWFALMLEIFELKMISILQEILTFIHQAVQTINRGIVNL